MSILLLVDVIEIELADDTVRFAMSILPVSLAGLFGWDSAPEIVSETASPTDTFAAVAFEATTLVIVLYDLVDVTLVADAPETVSDWALPLASVPVMTKLFVVSSPTNLSFKAWLVRKRKPLANRFKDPPAPTLCAGATAVSEATMPT